LVEAFNDESCLVFESESAASLAEQLLAAYERRNDLKQMGMAARRRFEQEFALEVFGRRFLAFIGEHEDLWRSRRRLAGEPVNCMNDAMAEATADGRISRAGA
jgi:hypothetical protein